MVTLQPENNTLVVLIAPSIPPIKPNTPSLRYSFIWQHHMLWLSCAFFLGLTDEVFLKLRIFTNKADLSCFLLTRSLLRHFPWWGVGGSRAQWQVCRTENCKIHLCYLSSVNRNQTAQGYLTMVVLQEIVWATCTIWCIGWAYMAWNSQEEATFQV